MKNAPRLAEWTMALAANSDTIKDRVVGGWAADEVPGHRVAHVTDLVWAAGVGGGVAGYRGWFRLHSDQACAPDGPEAVEGARLAEPVAGRRSR